MRLPIDRGVQCLRLLLEGNSIRSTERLTGVHRDTILKLLVIAGEKSSRLLEDKIYAIPVNTVQADEIWGFIYCKEKTKRLYPDSITIEGAGDFYCFVGIESDTKLILAWHLGRRTSGDTEAFIAKLSIATSGNFQLTTDGFHSYPEAINNSELASRVEYAQLEKVFARGFKTQSPFGERRYSPVKTLRLFKTPRIGNPDRELISTSYIERQNLTMRMTLRRLTRLTNAYSKKWDNLHAALALYFAYYNFCRVHSSIKCTPAMASEVTDHVWKIDELLST
jgi:IS1 family transposase